MGKRRLPGEGSIFRRTTKLPDGRTRVRWQAQLRVGDRTPRRFVTRTCRTSREAAIALAELRADREAMRNPSRLTLGAYLRWWLDETARPSVTANTYRGYEDALAHLAPIADIPLDRLTPEDIEATCNRMTTHRGKIPRQAAPKTVRNLQIMLRRALSQAVGRGHIRRNVAALVPLRHVPRVSRDPLTPDLARAILAAVRGDRYEAAFALAFLGLRVGEFLGLTLRDLCLAEPAVANVRYQTVGSGKRAIRTELKTAASASAVPLPPFVVERLKAHLAGQDAERPFVPLDGNGLVFVTQRGYAVSGSWLTKHFQLLLERAGLPRMRLHDLRHGAASLLVEGGVHPRIVQELLRHASSRTTMDIYSHVSAAQQRDAVDALERMVRDDQSPSQSRVVETGVTER
jgi:integrase